MTEQKTATVTIQRVESPADLYLQYAGQCMQQSCHIDLYTDSDGDWCMMAESNPEIGNAIPMTLWHGRMMRYGIPCLTADAANALMEEILPLAERVAAGYDEAWNGNNFVGTLTEDAQAAHEEINQICRECDGDQVVVYNARDWYEYDNTIEGLTADTTDEQLDEIEQREESIAKDNGCHVIEGLREYLEEQRQEMRDERDDD